MPRSARPYYHSCLRFGAGDGQLCLQLLSNPALAAYSYVILEISAAARARQRALIQQQLPAALHRVRWLDHWPQEFNGVVIANEVLDAMPVHMFQQGESLQEYFVTVSDESSDAFAWVLQAPSDPALVSACAALPIGSGVPYRSEINLALPAWCVALSAAITRGVVLLVDYGFSREVYYHPQRDQGTVMCHYQHQAHDNPLVNVGLQDITAHVDFTWLATCARQAGFEVAACTSQAQFLLDCGLLSHAPPVSQQKDYLAFAQAVKRLNITH